MQASYSPAKGSAKAQASNVLASQIIDRQSLFLFEKHFIAPEIYQRPDVATRQIELARIVATAPNAPGAVLAAQKLFDAAIAIRT